MKCKIALLSMVFTVMMGMTCFAATEAGWKNFEPTDYSDMGNWSKNDYTNPKKADAKVDVIFINGTVMQIPENETGTANISNDLKKAFDSRYVGAADVYDVAETRMYVPYYRQVTLGKALTGTTHEDLPNWIANSEAGADLMASLDYYFKNYNNGRPFILAGYSQGGASVQFLLENYFVKGGRKSLLKRMVAAYSVAYAVDQEWLRNNGLEFAKTSDDTGVVLSWVTEGPDATDWYIVLSDDPSRNMVINPINWKTDTTYAKAEECLGTYENGRLVSPGLYNLQIKPERGVLICDNHESAYLPDGFWGGKSLHAVELSQAYGSVRKNMLDRINAFLAE